MRLSIALAALTVSLSGSAGCDTRGDLACTEIGCGDGYTVAVLSPGRFVDGVYRLQVTADGQGDDCSWSIENGRIGAETCGATYQVGASYPVPEAVAVSYPPVEGAVRIVVSRDGATLEDRTLAPAYRDLQPNGPDCPPVCRVARTEIALG